MASSASAQQIKDFETLRSINESPINYINEYFTEIKNKIDSCVERLLEKKSSNEDTITGIQIKRDSMIELIEKIESDCLTNFKTKKSEMISQLSECNMHKMNNLGENLRMLKAKFFAGKSYYFFETKERKSDMHFGKIIGLNHVFSSEYSDKLIEQVESDKEFEFTSKHLTSEYLLTYIAEGLITEDLRNPDQMISEINLFSNVDSQKELIIYKEDIRSIDNNAFEKFRNLKILKIYRNKLGQIQDGLFKGLDKLDELSIAENEIESISPKLFEGLGNLKTLNLGQNKIGKLEDNVFSLLINLETLYLNGNKLETLTRSVFNGLKKLKNLDLKNNQFKKLDNDLFIKLDSLEVLFLSNNQLESLSQSVFNGLFKNLRLLFLTDNKLNKIDENTFEKFEVIKEIHLSKNPYKTFENLKFSNEFNGWIK